MMLRRRRLFAEPSAAMRAAGLAQPEWNQMIAIGAPFHKIPLKVVLDDECLILEEMLEMWGLAASLSEARRLCKQGGIRVNGIQIKDPKMVLGLQHVGMFCNTLVIKVSKGRKEAFWYIIEESPEELAEIIGEPSKIYPSS